MTFETTDASLVGTTVTLTVTSTLINDSTMSESISLSVNFVADCAGSTLTVVYPADEQLDTKYYKLGDAEQQEYFNLQVD